MASTNGRSPSTSTRTRSTSSASKSKTKTTAQKAAATRKRKSAAAAKVERAVGEVVESPTTEAAGEAITVQWEGMDLYLPPEMPAGILFDFVEMESEGFSPLPMIRTLRTLVGPDQFLAVRTRVQELGAGLDVALNCLNTLLEAYGMSLGESPASADS